MNLYIISFYCSICSFLRVASANFAESALLREEQNDYAHEAISAAKATDYTLYFESRHFDLMNEDDWNEYKVSTQPLDSKQAYDNSLGDALLQQEEAKLFIQHDDYNNAPDQDDYYQHLKMDKNIQQTLQQALFHGHRLLSAQDDEDYDDELYYNYYKTDHEGQTQILNEIHACSQEIEALDDRKLCVHWHHDHGLRLGMTDNAHTEEDTMMMEFNNDEHWNRVDIVDNINKAAARGYMESNTLNDDDDDDLYYEDYGYDNDEDYNEYYEDYYADPILDSRRRAMEEDMDEGEWMSDLAFVFEGLAQRKCQSFEGYTLCAKYNPSERRYRINVDMALGRNPKSGYQQNRQNIQQSAAKVLTDNILSIGNQEDEFVYDDDDAMAMDDEETSSSTFQYGDVFTLIEKDAAQIGWKSLQNYGGEAPSLREDTFAASVMDGMSDDYTFYFDDWKFNWNNDYDWDDDDDDSQEKDKEQDTANDKADGDMKSDYYSKARTEKCTPVIPGLDHKVCLSLSEQNIGLRFAAGSEQEVSDMLYDIYASYDGDDYDEDYYDEDYDDLYEDEDGYYDDEEEYYEDSEKDFTLRRRALYDDSFDAVLREFGDDYQQQSAAYEQMYDDLYDNKQAEMMDDFDAYQQDEQFEDVLRSLDDDDAHFYDDYMGDEYELDDQFEAVLRDFEDEYEDDEDAIDAQDLQELYEAYDDDDYDYEEDAYDEDDLFDDAYDLYDDDDDLYEDELYDMNDAELDALYDALDEYDEYYDNYLNDFEQTIRTALTTEFDALGQLDFNNNDDWDKVQIIHNAAKTTEDDRVDDYYYDEDGYYEDDEAHDYEDDEYTSQDAEDYDSYHGEDETEDDEYSMAAAKEYFGDYLNDDLDDTYYDLYGNNQEDMMDDLGDYEQDAQFEEVLRGLDDEYDQQEDDYYDTSYRRRMQAPAAPAAGAAPVAPAADATPATPAANEGGESPRPKDAFKEGYEMGSLMEPQVNLRKRGKRKRSSRRQNDRLTKAIIYAELDGENRVLRALQKAEMESEAIGGGAIPGGGPPGFGYNGGKYSGLKTTGGRGLVIGQNRRRRSKNGRRYNPRKRPRIPQYGHYPVLPAAPRPYYDNRDFTMPPPPPPLFSRISRPGRRRRKPVITVKHYHYNMGRPRRRRRRRSRKGANRGLISAVLGPGFGRMGRHKAGRRRRRRGGRRRKHKRRRRKRRRRKKKHSKPRSFGAMMEDENMAYDEYYDDDNAAYFDTIEAFGTGSMASTLDMMDMNAYGVDEHKQLRKCKAFAMTEACVTLDPHRGDLMLEVSVGSKKAKEGYAAANEEYDMFDYGAYDDEEEYYEFNLNEDVEDVFNDAEEQNEWMVTDVAADEQYDEVWDDDANWEQIDEIETLSGNFVQRKCLHVWGQRLCLCQFLAFLDNRKFQCQPKGYRFYNPQGPSVIPQQQMKIAQKSATKGFKEHEFVKEEEIKPIKPIKIEAVKPKMSKTKLKAVVDKALKKAVKKEEKKEEAKEKAKQEKKKKPVQLLVPKHIPYKFEPIKIPNTKPKWLPHWMWSEFKTQNEHHKQEKKARTVMKKTMKKTMQKERIANQKMEKKELEEKKKVLAKVKVAAKKQIKKDLEKEIEKEKVKAAKKTEKKVAKETKKIIKKEIKTQKKNIKLKKKIEEKKAAAMDGYFDNYYDELDEDYEDYELYDDDEEDVLELDDAYQNALDAITEEDIDRAVDQYFDDFYADDEEYDEDSMDYYDENAVDRALDELYYDDSSIEDDEDMKKIRIIKRKADQIQTKYDAMEQYFDEYLADYNQYNEDSMDNYDGDTAFDRALDELYYDDSSAEDDEDEDDDVVQRIRIIKKKISERKAKWARAAARNQYYGDEYMADDALDDIDDAFDRALDELYYDSVEDDDETAAMDEYFADYFEDNDEAFTAYYDDAFARVLDELSTNEDDENAAMDEDYADYYNDEEYNEDILDNEYQNALDDELSYYASYDDELDNYYESIDSADNRFDRALDELYYENADDEYDRALDQLYYDLSNYYDDEDSDYYYEDVSNTAEFGITERDHWHDTSDDNDWIVSSLSTTDLDNVWEDPSQWELSDKIKTESGRTIQRKCLHMWHHRLCLCQFLEWIDDAKYKCYPRGEQVPIMRPVPKPKSPVVKKEKKVVSKFHKILSKLKEKHAHSRGQGILLKKLEGDISKLESLQKTKGEPHSIESGLADKEAKHKAEERKEGVKPVTKKLIQQTIKEGNTPDAMREPRDVVKGALLDTKKHSGGAGNSAYAQAHDVHSPQLSRIEALLHHLVLTKVHSGPHWDGGPHNPQLGRIESMLLHLAARQHAAQHGIPFPMQGGPQRPFPMRGTGGGGHPMMLPQGKGPRGGYVRGGYPTGGYGPKGFDYNSQWPTLKPEKEKESPESDETSEEQSEAHGYTSPGQVRSRYRHSERLWRKRQRGIGPGQGGKEEHGMGRALGGLMKGINKETDEGLNSPRAYFHGKHLPTFGDHPGHGDIHGTGFKGDIPNVPLHWHLAGVHAPNIGPQQHLIMSQPAHPDYPRKSYYMVITGYPKYGLPQNRPAWIPSYMWSQMQALQHRGIDVANQLDDEDNLLDEEMTNDYDDYDYYTNNGLDEEEQQLETYYEDYEGEWLDVNDGEQWVIMEDADGLDDEIVTDEQWNDDALWELMEKAITNKGLKVEKKCMNVFGRPLCLCTFVDWVLHGRLTKKQCGPKEKMKQVKPPKNKPKWMPHNFWGYLNEAQEPHKPPSDVNRKKWKLYMKFKKKGYAAKDAQFGDYMLYDDDEEMMDALLADIEGDYDEEDQTYDNALLDALIDGDFEDDEEATAILDEVLKDDAGDMYEEEENSDEYESYDDALLDALVDGDYYDSVDEDQIIDQLLHDEEKQSAKEALIDKLLVNAYGEYEDADDDEYYADEDEAVDEAFERALDELYYDDDEDAAATYDEYYMDDEDEIEAKAVSVADWWVDDDDDNEWVVTDQSTDDYDEKWQEDGEWDRISKRIRTKSGHLMTRKCLTIWKKRLCFCQFLNWIDGKKYKCMPRTEASDGFASDLQMDDYEEYEDEDIYENYDEYEHTDDMNTLMEKYAANAIVNDQMFDDNSNWDTQAEFMFGGAHLIKKCKRFLGIDWCYCKSKQMTLPWPCFNIPHMKKKTSSTKPATKGEGRAISKQPKIDRAYFENSANWNFVSDSSGYGTQQDLNAIHGDMYHVTRKCKTINGQWTCYCEALDKAIFLCNKDRFSIENAHQDYDDKDDEEYTNAYEAYDDYNNEVYEEYNTAKQEDEYAYNEAYDYDAEEEEETDEYLQSVLESETGDYSQNEDVIANIRDYYESMEEGTEDEDDKYYISGDGSNMNYMEELKRFMHRGSQEAETKGQYDEDMDDYNSLNEEEKQTYDKHMSAMNSYMNQISSQLYKYADDDYSDALAAYQKQNEDYFSAELAEDNYYDEDEYDDNNDDEWSNANQILNNYYEQYSDLYDNQYSDLYDNLYDDVAVEEDESEDYTEEDWANANVALEDEYADLYDEEEEAYGDIYDDVYKEQEYDNLYDDLYDDEYEIVDSDADNYGWAYNDDDYAEIQDDDDEYNEESMDVYNAESEYSDNLYDDLYEDEMVQQDNYETYDDDNDAAYDNEYDHVYDDIYDVIYNDDAYDDDSYDTDGDMEPRVVPDLHNNAWVWQLLILSFSLGVCSCLCYYATKIKPTNGVYDFSHYRHKAAYSKVSFESGISAYDHDDIIEHPSQSDIEQSN